MISTILVSILLCLTTLLLSFLEAGAILQVALRQEWLSESDPERKDVAPEAVASVGAVVAVMILLRLQLVVAASGWLLGSLHHYADTNVALFSTVMTYAVVLAEIIGKLLAIRYPARSRRTVEPFRKLLARVKPTWFHYGG